MSLMLLLSRLLGLAVGVLVCLAACAWAGGVIGATLGISVGYLAGALLHEFGLIGIRLCLKCLDTANLRARLARDYSITHLIIAELVARGEPVEQFRGHVEALVRSNSVFQRDCGKKCRKKWFPSMTP